MSDVADFDYGAYKGTDLVAGGPPCQPFSQAGKAMGHADRRDMFPQAIRAVREIQPPFFLFENVKGLIRGAFWDYCDYVGLQLQYLGIERGTHETWIEHHLRLRQHHLSAGSDDLYRVSVHHLNAADYGVAQVRERVFFMGVRHDIRTRLCLPTPTNSREALYESKWGSGEYWERHRIPSVDRPPRPADSDRLVDSEGFLAVASATSPWLTLRDAICDLPEPKAEPEDGVPSGHVLVPGARYYSGHTGSALDEPAKALKAGAHGVPGGENMVLLPSGEVRYFTLRECARLQSLPDDFVLPLPWTRTMGALGNAVPVVVAAKIAGGIARALELAGAA